MKTYCIIKTDHNGDVTDVRFKKSEETDIVSFCKAVINEMLEEEEEEEHRNYLKGMAYIFRKENGIYELGIEDHIRYWVKEVPN